MSVAPRYTADYSHNPQCRSREAIVLSDSLKQLHCDFSFREIKLKTKTKRDGFLDRLKMLYGYQSGVEIWVIGR